MKDMTFAIVGGDERFVLLADMLESEGRRVHRAGLCGCGENTAQEVSDAVAAADAVILPLPATRDGAVLNAPFSQELIPLDKGFFEQLSGKRVFAGQAEKLREAAQRSGFCIEPADYYENEALLQINAQLTAEAALMLAVMHTRCSVFGCECLITGFGRIGRALAPMLRAMGANVTVAARKASDAARIESLGMRHCAFSQLEDIAGGLALVINTVPARIFNKAFLAALPEGTPMIELASAPGGVDADTARCCGVKLVPAPALPGKYAPEAAARIIKSTILDMMEEE